MSRTESHLRALEGHWQIERLPEEFYRLYRAFEYPFIGPCEFLGLEELIQDTERWRGMLPQFLPFGHDGAEDFYGFYVPADASGGDFTVLFWDHEYDHYYPIASGFGAFLHWCVISDRYFAQDAFEEDGPPFEEEARREEFSRLLGLPPALATELPPRNEREFHERLIVSDAQAAFSLAQLGCIFHGRGNLERARDYFARASEAAPWFADPYYLLAETYRAERKTEQALERWWQVFQCPIALSTRTGSYDLGESCPDAEICEAAMEQVLRNRDILPDAMRNTLLYRLLTHCDPFDPQARLALADELLALGDSAGAEREMLNGLTLAVEEADIDAAYSRLIAFYEGANRRRDAEFCRRDARQR